jgi:cytochrome c2
MRSYSAAVLAALGGAFVVTCVSWDARHLLAGNGAGKEKFEKRCTGCHTWISDLQPKIMRYIRLYGKTAEPFRWKYADPIRRIKPW